MKASGNKPMKQFICITFVFFTAVFAFSQSEEDMRVLFNAIKDANYELFTYYIEKKASRYKYYA